MTSAAYVPLPADSPTPASRRDSISLESQDALLSSGIEGSLPPEKPLEQPMSARVDPPLHPALMILIWISLSSAVIFWNAHLIKKFPYPASLTTCHLLFQTLMTQALARFTTLIPQSKADDPDQPVVSKRIYWSSVVPIGILFAVSLVLSNYVYIFLTVSFIQMIKAGSPCAVLAAAFIFRLREPSLKLVAIILMISGGVVIASLGEVDFNMFGFLIQVVAIAVEATRLSLIQILLQGLGLTPLQSLHAMAPVCLAALASAIIPMEGFASVKAIPEIGFFTLLANSALTGALNLSGIYLIGISSLVLSLSKVVKDVMIVVLSALLLGTPITSLQIVGYGIAIGGLAAFKAYG